MIAPDHPANNRGGIIKQTTKTMKKLPPIALNSTSQPLYAIDHSTTSTSSSSSSSGPKKRLNLIVPSKKRQIRFRFGFATPDKLTGQPCRNTVEEHEVVLLWSPMSMSGRAIIVTCDGMEVHNSTMKGVNMVVDVTWNFRGKGNNQKLVMRIVAHASLASCKVKGSGRQYELFVNGVSYFNFLSVDQLKVNNSSGGGGVVGNNKRPVQRHSMIEKRGPHYNNIEQHQASSADSRRHSSGEIGRNHHRPKSLSKSLPQALEQSDRSSSRALSSSSRRKYSQVNNIDESDTSRLSYHSDMSPPLDNDPSLRPGVGGRRMNHNNNNSLPTALNGSSRSLRMGKQVQKKLSNGDESDRSARSRDSSLKQQHTHKTVHSTPASSIDQSDRSQRRRQVIRSKSAIDRSDRSSSSSSLDRSDLSRRQKLMKSQSAIDRSDRSSRSDRGNLAQLRSLIMDESDRSARSRDYNPRLQPQQSVKNIYNPVEKPRRETIMSTLLE
jgi:hypothetical protein